jgi:HSP20 family protein
MPASRPFEEEIIKLRDRMNQLLSEPVGAGGESEPMDAMEWVPLLDVLENKDEITVRIDVPGMEPAEIDVSISGDVLHIKGERKQEVEREDENYHVIERDYGKFDRRVELPTSVDMDSIKASYKNGVLIVRLPKLEEKEVEEIRVDLA